MLAHTGHDKAYPLSDQVDTPNTVGYEELSRTELARDSALITSS